MATDVQKAREQWEAYVYARDNGHTDFVKKAERCDDFFYGLQWDSAIRAKLERENKPVLTINELFATLITTMGEQVEARADVAFQPARRGLATTAEALDKLWLHTAKANNFDWVESSVADDAFITSRSFFDIRASFEDHLLGEARITRKDNRDVVLSPDIKDYDPDTWPEVFVTRWMSPSEIGRLYSEEAGKTLEVRADPDFLFGYDSVEGLRNTLGGYPRVGSPDNKRIRRNIRVVERQYREVRMREHFVDPVTGDMRPIPQTWDHNRISTALRSFGWMTMRRRAEQIRWLVTADSLVLHDEWSPYKHLTIVPYFPFFRNGRTIGMAENLLSPQEMLNKAESQELHIINSTANGGWKVKDGSLTNMEPEELEARGAQTGLVMMLDDVKNAEKITANSIPQGLDRVAFKAKEHLQSISNVSESQRGQDRADVAARAIQAKQQAGRTSLIKPFDNLNFTRKLVARTVLDLWQSYYTEERVLQINGRGPGDKSEELVVNQVTPEGEVLNDLTVGEYDVVVSTTKHREGFMESQFEQLVTMRQELGIPVPVEFLIENSNVKRKTELIKAIKEAQGEGDPTETEQQMAELELQLKMLEVREKEVKTELDEATRRYTDARAAKTLSDADEGQDGDAQADLEAALAHQREMKRMDDELALQREKMEGELALKREQMEKEHTLKRAEAAERIDMEAKRESKDGEGK